MQAVLEEAVDRDHTKDQGEETLVPEDHLTETAKDLNLDPQCILGLLQPLPMTTQLLQDSVLILIMELLLVLSLVTGLLQGPALVMEHLQGPALSMELLQGMELGMLLLGKFMPVSNQQGVGQERGQGKDLGSKISLLKNF